MHQIIINHNCCYMNNKDSTIILKQHQKNIVDYMSNDKNRGLILYHATGTGKTITAIMSLSQHPEQIIIIGKKSSKKAFVDDMKKINNNRKIIKNHNKENTQQDDVHDIEPKYLFYTFSKIKKVLKDNFIMFSGKSVIVDEAHTLRNETNLNLEITHALGLAKRVMLLTATPVINYMNDLCVLVNIIKNSSVLPTDIETFNAAYYDSNTNSIENPDILVKKLQNCISYYKPKNELIDYPEHTQEYIEVEMSYDQLMEYKKYIKKYFFDVQLDYRCAGKGEYFVDFQDKSHGRKKNFFLSGTRQLSNTLNGDPSYPKIKSLFDMTIKQFEQKLTPIIIYSNYLENGVYPLTKLLERSNVKYKTITGNTSEEKINFIVNDYNKRNIDVLLITSAGSESLDLKNTRIIHIMEPHWNESRITQVIGRAVRFKSHSELPKTERNVKIFRWSSVFPDTISNKSADQYLIELSKNKDEIIKTFDQIIQDAAIENNNINKYDDYERIRKLNRSSDVIKIKSKQKQVQKGGINIDEINEQNYKHYVDNKRSYMFLKKLHICTEKVINNN